MSIQAINNQPQTTESIQKLNEMFKNIVDTEMNLQDKMMKVNVREAVSEATGLGANLDVEA
jgi:hypothetical protein